MNYRNYYSGINFEFLQIENEYRNEIKAAVKEFEERKVELRETLISDLEEKKKQVPHQSCMSRRMISSAQMFLNLSDTYSTMGAMRTSDGGSFPAAPF